MSIVKEIVEKAIRKYLLTHGHDPKCMGCWEDDHPVELLEPKPLWLCPAHHLDQALGDYELSETLLTVAYFKVLNG